MIKEEEFIRKVFFNFFLKKYWLFVLMFLKEKEKEKEKNDTHLI